jgi:NDP-sugar pyrophosphorylase family protein
MVIKDAVILAGGLGKRLRPLTEILPKPLLKVGNKSILESLILLLKKNKIKRVFIATNYLHDKIVSKIGDGKKYGVKIFYSKEKKKLGTCGPLSLLREKLQNPFFLLNGDILTNANLIKISKLIKKKSLLTVVTKEINLPFRFGKINSKNGFITNLVEKPTYKQEILAGIYLFKPEIFKFIPQNQYFGMDQLIKRLMKKKIKISKYLLKNYWIDIGQLDDYEIAKNKKK